jgi:hypothetical protein
MLSWLTSKSTLTLAIIAMIAVSLAVVSRNWSCRKQPAPIERTLGPYAVVSVDSGASITFEIRRRKHEAMNLPGIASPAKGQRGYEISCAGLATVIGYAEVGEDDNGYVLVDENRLGKITIHESKTKHLDRFDAGDVFSQSGQCLQISQLAAGLAWCNADAPKAYQAAQRAAQKKKYGLWSITDYDSFKLGETE